MSSQETAEACERLLAKHDKWADPANRVTARDIINLRRQGFEIGLRPVEPAAPRKRRVGRVAPGGPNSKTARAERAANEWLDQRHETGILGIEHFAKLHGAAVGYVYLKTVKIRAAREARGEYALRIYRPHQKIREAA